MPLDLSKTLDAIPASPTLAISARAKAMKKDGHDVVNFGVGEPDFGTPDNICQVGIRAIGGGQTRYTPASGTPELKQAIVDKYLGEYGVEYGTSEVIVSSGAKSSVYIALRALCNRGDNVIIPSPYWVSYPEMVKACDAKPKVVRTAEKDGFKLDPDKLARAITSKTKAIILNSPSNPTGAVYTRDELEAVCRVVLDAGIYVISDEIYEKLVYGDAEHHCLTSVCPEIRDRAIIINGPSKTYAMTGWRIGYALGPQEVVGLMGRYQSQVMGCPCSISQAATVEAIGGDQSEVARMRQVFDDRRVYIMRRIRKIPRVKLKEPKGAFYAFINIKSAMKQLGIETCHDFAMKLLEEKKVAAVPGGPFGAPGYLRFSYATSMETIEKGLDRLLAFVKGE